MLIVSQDKKQTVNIDNVTRLYIDELQNESFCIGADTNSAESTVWELGEYETEERAMKVLQEIIQVRALCEEIKAIDDNFMKRKFIGALRCKYFDTYEMPKE